MPILDTDILISFLRGKPQASAFIKSLIDKDERLNTTAINTGELYVGAYYSTNVAKDVRAIEDLLKRFTIWDFTKIDAGIYGQIQATLLKNGTPVGKMDVMIGAIAINHGEPLVTRNIAHFDRIPQLKLVNWLPTSDVFTKRDGPF